MDDSTLLAVHIHTGTRIEITIVFMDSPIPFISE